MYTLIANESILRAARKSDEMLEPYEWKRSCTVLRRERASNRPDLADYAPLVNALGGQTIHVSTTSRDYINPMDINMNYAGDDNPLWVKSDFILSLCELILDRRDGIEAGERSVIDRCLPMVYKDYFADPRPGDLIFFQGTYNTAGASHIGIYVGNGMMIHAGKPIQYANVNTSYFKSHFYQYGRLP